MKKLLSSDPAANKMCSLVGLYSVSQSNLFSFASHGRTTAAMLTEVNGTVSMAIGINIIL